jgi:hypothetical protein
VTNRNGAADPRERAQQIVAEVLGASAGHAVPEPAGGTEPVRSAAAEAAHRIVVAALAAGRGAEDEAETDAGPPPLPAALRATGSTAAPPAVAAADADAGGATIVAAPAVARRDDDAASIARALVAEVTGRLHTDVADHREPEGVRTPAPEAEALVPAGESPAPAAEPPALAAEPAAQPEDRESAEPVEEVPSTPDEPESVPVAAVPEAVLVAAVPESVPVAAVPDPVPVAAVPDPVPVAAVPEPIQGPPEARMRQLFAATTPEDDGEQRAAEPALVDGTDTPWSLAGDLAPTGAARSWRGRWVLTTILGAIALALLLPLAVAALRRVLALA